MPGMALVIATRDGNTHPSIAVVQRPGGLAGCFEDQPRRIAMFRLTCSVAAPIALLMAGCTGMAQTSSSSMPASSSGTTFFVTSTGSGKGADFGGLAGADKHCQTLAAAAGAGNHTWHAYLSTQGAGAVNAKDRIGTGPWRNAKGVVVANNVAELHGTNNLNKQTALTEKG